MFGSVGEEVKVDSGQRDLAALHEQVVNRDLGDDGGSEDGESYDFCDADHDGYHRVGDGFFVEHAEER